jgi:hypothetical protein
MDTEPMKKRWPRTLALLLFLLLFASMLGYTTVGVRFDVAGKTMTEYQVLHDSLTHQVLRAADGSLTAPQPAVAKPGQPAGKASKACPT